LSTEDPISEDTRIVTDDKILWDNSSIYIYIKQGDHSSNVSFRMREKQPRELASSATLTIVLGPLATISRVDIEWFGDSCWWAIFQSPSPARAVRVTACPLGDFFSHVSFGAARLVPLMRVEITRTESQLQSRSAWIDQTAICYGACGITLV